MRREYNTPILTTADKINKKFKLAEKFDWKMEQQIKGKLIKKE